jgi:hypothetical protein
MSPLHVDMGLEEFERSLDKTRNEKDSHRKRSRSRDRERRHRHHHHSERHLDSDRKDHDRESRQHHKPKRRRHGDREGHDKGSERSRDKNHDAEGEEDEWVEKEAAPPSVQANDVPDTTHRQSWMQAPSTTHIEYKARKVQESKSKYVRATQDDHASKSHEDHEPNHARDDNEDDAVANTEPKEREFNYTFGDSGASWRMAKLKNIYRQAKETGCEVEAIALEQFGTLQDFDDAREEEVEMDRRKTYGSGYQVKEKPTGELFDERQRNERRQLEKREKDRAYETSHAYDVSTRIEHQPNDQDSALDQTALNKLKAQLMKAKIRGASNVAELEAKYNKAVATSSHKQPDVVVLNAMENRMLVGGRKGEVTAITNKRGQERGLVKENQDMTIEDMVRQEKRTRGRGEGEAFAERIARDGKFTDDLDYMDENAEKLSKHVQKSDINLRSIAISDFQKMNKILDRCPLCHHEDKGTGPVAPVVSLGTRTFLTLPTEPELSDGGAVIVPMEHHDNLVSCDEDEWEEIRNFMKSLTRMYHDQGRSVIFYENAATPQRRHHAAMQVVPLPYSLGATAPAFFREAILSSDEEWSQHKKLIDTLAKAKGGLGRWAFRKTFVAEMPYFHVWFELDGGLGHIVEDAGRWPKGDLFAREVIGGMLDVGAELIKRQGRWHRTDGRLDGFRKRWRKFDWTRVLAEESAA